MQHRSGDDIGVFLTVCEAGSFASAAPRLALSPSAVAKAVARLEQRLSVRLFARTTRHLALTGEGATYRDVCRRSREDIEQAERALAALAREPAGPVRISLPPLLGARVVAPALFDLCRVWPHLTVDIATSTRPSTLMDDGVDLAVRIGDPGDLPGVTARALGMQRIVLCGSPDYIARRGMVVRVDDLPAHDLIATARHGTVTAWQVLGDHGERRSFRPETRLLLDGSLLTLAAIRAGHGLGQVPRWLVEEELADGRLIPVLEDRMVGHLPVHALWRSAPVMLPRLRVVIDAAAMAVRRGLRDA